MAISEFDIIHRIFSASGVERDDVATGIGDDGAVVRPPAGCDVVMVVDTLVAGVHFPPDTRPEDVGYKALAVNLSDMAAMAATPAWATLALTLPASDEVWVKAFAQGFFALADQYGIQLVGGDTTHGPLTVTVQVQGWVPRGQAVPRSGARPGDMVYLTGMVGDAGLALYAWRRQRDLPDPHCDYLYSRLHRPVPRSREAETLRDVATAMIDVSDGLAADLDHMLEASGVGATLDLCDLPLSPSFAAVTGPEYFAFDEAERLCMALSAGDDYELCFTVPTSQAGRVEQSLSRFACGCRAIGVIEQAPGLRLKRSDGSLLSLERRGYDHFAQDPGDAEG